MLARFLHEVCTYTTYKFMHGVIVMAENEMIICRCEEVTYGKLVETAEKYQCSPRELKLRTRAGMGYCGGRTCRSAVDSIALSSTERDISQITLKYQPPIRPISFSSLGEVANND